MTIVLTTGVEIVKYLKMVEKRFSRIWMSSYERNEIEIYNNYGHIILNKNERDQKTNSRTDKKWSHQTI